MLTNDFFHNTGIGDGDARGRADAVHAVSEDAFNCAGPFSDAGPDDCAELRFMKRDDPLFLGAFRTPSLRDVARTAPYMHAGQLSTLPDVLHHYNAAPPAALGTSELRPLGLTARELGELEAFLRTLDSPPALDAQWLRPPGS